MGIARQLFEDGSTEWMETDWKAACEYLAKTEGMLDSIMWDFLRNRGTGFFAVQIWVCFSLEFIGKIAVICTRNNLSFLLFMCSTKHLGRGLSQYSSSA